MSTRTRLALALLWLVLLALAGWAVSRQLDITGDLRKFMPAQAELTDINKLKAAPAADATEASVFCT